MSNDRYSYQASFFLDGREYVATFPMLTGGNDSEVAVIERSMKDLIAILADEAQKSLTIVAVDHASEVTR